MTNLMIQLRRSPRTLLERDGHPGPGPGHLAVVMSRAGVGKTAFLVGIGIDALLSGQKVLHISLERTVEKVRDWYDDLLKEMLRREKQLEHWTAIQLEVEKRRNIHTYVGRSFSADRLRDALDLLRDAMDFVPNVIILDRMEMEGFDPETIKAAKALSAEAGAELWMACRTSREEPASKVLQVEFGSVRWECLEVQTLLSSAKVSYRLAAVNSGIVPDYSDVSSKVSEKMAEKGSNVAAENVLGMKTGVQANSLPFWADRKSGDN